VALLGVDPALHTQSDRGGPELYGILLGTIGIGAAVGAFTLPSMKAAPGFGRHVWHGVQSGPAGNARHSTMGIAACLVVGVSWIVEFASLDVSVQ
jgi:hypothetical protein